VCHQAGTKTAAGQTPAAPTARSVPRHALRPAVTRRLPILVVISAPEPPICTAADTSWGARNSRRTGRSERPSDRWRISAHADERAYRVRRKTRCDSGIGDRREAGRQYLSHQVGDVSAARDAGPGTSHRPRTSARRDDRPGWRTTSFPLRREQTGGRRTRRSVIVDWAAGQFRPVPRVSLRGGRLDILGIWTGACSAVPARAT
jgi:hypothetical protein